MAVEQQQQEQQEEQQTQEQAEAVEQEEQTEGADTGKTEGEDGGEKEARTEETVAGEVTVQIGEAQTEQEEKAPGWVREVRQRNRELEKKNRELERQIQANGQQTIKVGPKPKLEDHDFDAEKFEKALDEWHAKKRQADDAEKRIEEQQKAEQKAWQGKLDAYGTSKTALKVPDYDDAEALVHETLSEKQQAIILSGAQNPALLIYALGKNPGKLKELAAVKDLVAFAFATARVEGQLKVTPKKATPPAPEKKVEGHASTGGALDGTLDKLRDEAARTGDYTKVREYRRKMEKKAA